MIKFHKIMFALILCFLVALAACSPAAVQQATDLPGEATQAADTSPSVTAAPAITETPIMSDEKLLNVDLPAGIELKFWHIWSGSQAGVFEDLVDEFNRTNQWGIQVLVEGHGDELVMLEDIAQAEEKGTLPDIVAAPSRYLRLWDQQGIAVKDLNEYMDSDELGFDREIRDAFLPAFWKTDLDESGKRLGFPAYRSGNFLFYNQSWAQDLGFDAYPQTISAFAEQACAAGAANLADSDLENNGTGGWIYNIQSTTGYSWLKAFSGDTLVGEDGEVNFTEDSNQTALETLYDWYGYDQNCSWTGNQTEPHEYFARRFALFYSGSSEDIFVQELSNRENNSTDDWLLIPYPTDEYRPIVLVNGISYALLGEDEDKSLAGWLFLRFMLSTENQVRIIEETGSLPLSNTAISLLADFRKAHPAWDQALQFIAVAQTMPLDPEWIEIELVFSDITWQLRFTLSRDNIPEILREADAIVQEINAE